MQVFPITLNQPTLTIAISELIGITHGTKASVNRHLFHIEWKYKDKEMKRYMIPNSWPGVTRRPTQSSKPLCR